MKVRTQQNFNRKTYETVFGISIMPDGLKKADENCDHIEIRKILNESNT